MSVTTINPIVRTAENPEKPNEFFPSSYIVEDVMGQPHGGKD